MRKYFFVVPSLPPQYLNERPELSFQDLMLRLKVSLSKSDLEKAKVLRLFVDLCNIRALLMEEPIDPHGNLTEKELDEAILVHTILPDYVFDFLDHYDTVSEKIRNFPGLLARFFNEEIPRRKGFLRKYLAFEREWRLVLVGVRSKLIGRDVARELQFEDPQDPLVAQILAQKDSDRYDPPAEYADLKELILSYSGDPIAEYRAFAEYRFKKVQEMTEADHFSIDQILSYIVQLMILEHFYELDTEKGDMILQTFKSG